MIRVEVLNMGAVLLAYNIMDQEKKQALNRIFGFLGFKLKRVDKEAFNKPVGELVGLLPEKVQDEYKGDGFEDEMLVISTDNEETLNKALFLMREDKVQVSLKAMVTANNKEWSGLDLHKEIKKEHEYMNKRDEERKENK